MDISRQNIDELNAVINIKVEHQDYEKEVEKILKDYRKKANIKGFRVGMAPMGMIKKMYGKAILLDEVNKIVSRSLTDYLKEEKLEILGEPMPSENSKLADFDKDKDFDFAFDVGLTPEFEIKLSKRDKIPYYFIKVNEDDVNKTIENQQMQAGENKEMEVVEQKDLLKGKFEQLDEKGNLKEDGITTEDATFLVDRVSDKDIQKLMIGAKKEDIIDFDIKKAFINVSDLASMLRIEKEIAETLSGSFRFTLQSISRLIPAEINQDLFDKIYGKDIVKSEEEYKEKIREGIKKEFLYESEFRFSIDAREKLVNKAKINLPDEFLKRWLVAVNEGLTKEKVEEDYAEMQKEFAWQLIKNKIAKENEIKVEEADLVDYAKKSILLQFRKYGLSNLPEEQLEAYAKNTLSNPEEKNKINESVWNEKVVEYVKGTVKLDEKEITVEEFSALFSK